MDSPSWKDALHAALGPCMPCFTSHDSDNESNSNSRRPPQHLEALLADVQDTDTEAETVSLHSNVGTGQPRKKKRRPHKRITFFGIDLFGRRDHGAIHLPEDEEEVDRLLHRSGHRRRNSASTRATRSSSLTFDSDAASLDPAAIDQLTPAQLEERAREVEQRAAEERRAKEERRRLRREKKEMKRLAARLASGVEDSGEFEGFQGSGNIVSPASSGSGYPYIPSPLLGSPAGTGAQSVDDDADGSADLDGMLYTGRSRSSVTGGNSDSQRTPSSAASYAELNLTPSSEPSTRKKKKSGSSKSKSSRSRSSATSSTQSPSLASPVGTEFANLPLPSKGNYPGKPTIAMPHSHAFAEDDRGFPSPGLGGGPRSGRVGAFLASRGDDDLI